MANIKILLVDDHRMIRQGLRALLKEEADFDVIAEAEEGRSAVQLAKDLSPDVVVMDVRMPGLNGVDATRQILGDNPATKVVALSAQSDPQSTTAMLQAGAVGYVIKDAAFEELITAVRTAVAGRVYLSPAVAGSVVSRFVRPDGGAAAPAGEPATAFNTLSAREREVLQLIAEGKSTKEVAAVLHVSVKTVETHRQHMMQKLGVDGVTELTKYAIREGLTGL